MERNNKKASEDNDIRVLIYCTSDLLLAGILKALEAYSDVEIVNVEKSTIESFMASVKGLLPHVILFANSDPLPNIKRGISPDPITSLCLMMISAPG